MDASSQVESLQQTICRGEGADIKLMDKLEEKTQSQEHLLDRMMIKEALGSLGAKERELIYKRYFQDMTQTAIARDMGMTPGAGFQNGEKNIKKYAGETDLILFCIFSAEKSNTIRK